MTQQEKDALTEQEAELYEVLVGILLVRDDLADYWMED